MSNPYYLTIELVREELQDRTPADNSIDCDQFFSDDEIRHAMDRAAARYNSLPPIGVDVVGSFALPTNSCVFLDMVLSSLYSVAIHKLARNLATWSTGGTTVDLEKTRMVAFQQLKAELTSDWREMARERKAELNRANAWGSF